MEKIAIIGGGASGMVCAVLLARKGHSVTLLERGDRLGRKLSATGNGQGNLTNVHMGGEYYFSDDPALVSSLLDRFGVRETLSFFEGLGGVYQPDARGRVYPAGRQASALTDLLRREIARLKIDVKLGTHVKELTYERGFLLKWETGQMFADKAVLSAGGKAAKNFGTDGSAYQLAEGFSHTVTPLSPVLVQLRCDPKAVRGLKGVRADAALKLMRSGKEIYAVRGDVLFTESGVSGDAVFRASSYAREGDTLLLNFLPDAGEEEISRAVSRGGALCLVPNALGRFLEAKGDLRTLLTAFPLTVAGTLGFDYAQATRGGIPLKEVDGRLQSKKRAGLYFTGEILNVDGACGGYNLQWAFTSAFAVAEGIS